MVLSNEYLGTRCEIKTMQNDLLAVGTLQKMDGDVFLVGPGKTRSDRMPLLPYKEKVKIILFHSNLGTQILAGSIFLSNNKFVTISDVEKLSDFEKRDAFRVNVIVHTVINYQEEKNSEEQEEKPAMPATIPVDIRDLSLTGVSFFSDHRFEPGASLEIMLALLNAKRYYFKCRIVRVIPNEDRRNRSLYGCSFIETTDEMMSDLCAYLFQQQRIQLHKTKKSAGGVI